VNDLETLHDISPYEQLTNDEFVRIVEKLSSFICILENKKMNMPSVFVCLVENEEYFRIYMELCGFDDPREAVKKFLDYDHSIAKSKFIRKITNTLQDFKI
jgi:hypothetical protein